MDTKIAAAMAEIRGNLADYRTRVTASLMDSHLAVRETETLIAETRDLLISLDHLLFPR